jgi:hypothetical protein
MTICSRDARSRPFRIERLPVRYSIVRGKTAHELLIRNFD